MISRRILFLLAQLFCYCCLASGDVFAQEPCEQARSQRELTACWATAAKKTEAALAEQLAATESSIEKGGQEEILPLFHDTQHAWEQYRDSQCALQQKRFQGGSAESMAGSICRQRMAKTRIHELRIVRDEWGQR